MSTSLETFSSFLKEKSEGNWDLIQFYDHIFNWAVSVWVKRTEEAEKNAEDPWLGENELEIDFIVELV